MEKPDSLRDVLNSVAAPEASRIRVLATKTTEASEKTEKCFISIGSF